MKNRFSSHERSLRQVAAELGISYQRLSDYERGKHLPSKDNYERLQSLVKSGRLIIPPDALLKVPRLDNRRPDLQDYSQDPWEKSASQWTHVVRSLNDLPPWFRHIVRCDSHTEAVHWLRMGRYGAKPGIANPHQLGYRRHPIVDLKGWALGERLLPCLHWSQPDFESLVWPQVSLRTSHETFRVDGLLSVGFTGPGKWALLEIDGRGHHSQNDDYRTTRLDMPTIRLTQPQIWAPNYADILAAAIRTLK